MTGPPFFPCGDPNVAGASPTRCFSCRTRASFGPNGSLVSPCRTISIPVECTIASKIQEPSFDPALHFVNRNARSNASPRSFIVISCLARCSSRSRSSQYQYSPLQARPSTSETPGRPAEYPWISSVRFGVADRSEGAAGDASASGTGASADVSCGATVARR